MLFFDNFDILILKKINKYFQIKNTFKIYHASR